MKAILDEIKQIIDKQTNEGKWAGMFDEDALHHLKLDLHYGVFLPIKEILTDHEGEYWGKEFVNGLPPMTKMHFVAVLFSRGSITQEQLGEITDWLKGKPLPAPPKEACYEAEHPEECCPVCGMLEVVCMCEEG